MTNQPEDWPPQQGGGYPQSEYPTQAWSPPPAAPPSRPWYRKLRFMLPIGVVGGIILGAAASGGSSASPTAGPAATTTVTTTASAAPVTVTSTAPAAKAAAPAATTPPAVAAVLKAWTDAGPKPDQQHAAMAALKAQWPTLANALEKATGVKAPAGAAPAPAPASATIPGDGTFEVGSDIKPGTYKSPRPDSGNCYWARLRDDKNSINSIIDNNNSAGPSVVTIHSSDRIFESSGCNDWLRTR